MEKFLVMICYNQNYICFTDRYTVEIPNDCKDDPSLADCSLIVQGQFCGDEHYKIICCKSCTLANREIEVDIVTLESGNLFLILVFILYLEIDVVIIPFGKLMHLFY